MTDERPDVLRLLQAMKRDQAKLSDLLEASSGREGEDLVYRFWHQSFKVYMIQDVTTRLVDALRALSPTGRSLNPWFETIVADGTGRTFDLTHNERWLEVARPMLEASSHARFFVEMAVEFGRDLEEPPNALPSGWAALLYLYELR